MNERETTAYLEIMYFLQNVGINTTYTTSNKLIIFFDQLLEHFRVVSDEI